MGQCEISSAISIVEIDPEEACGIHDLLRRLSSSDELGFPKVALRHYWAIWSVEKIKREARSKQSVFLVARRQEEPVGLLLGTAPEGGVGSIIWLLVVPQLRSQGIGSRLFLQACESYHKLGCHKVKLTVPGKCAVTFYEKQGMKAEGIHRDHWWHMDFWSI